MRSSAEPADADASHNISGLSDISHARISAISVAEILSSAANDGDGGKP